MKNLTLLAVSIVISSLLALGVDTFVTAPDTRNMIIVGVSGVVFLFLCANYFSSLKYIEKYGKTFLFVACALLIQLLVLLLGGVKSPFFIFLHLFLLGTSFLFGSLLAIVFLCSSLVVLLVQLGINPTLHSLFLTDPITVIFVLASYCAIVPLVYVLSGSYQNKEKISKVLTEQISLDETILQGVDEMLIVTDKSLRIVSINDAVEKMLNKANIEILEQDIFSLLFLKNTKGEVLSKDNIHMAEVINDKKNFELPDLLLLPLNGEATQKVVLKISPVIDLEGKVDQICFFIINTAKKQQAGDEDPKLAHAQLMYEARVEDLKQRLISSGMSDLHNRFMFTNKLHEDILLVENIENHGLKPQKVRFDVARSCQEIVKREREYTTLFKTEVSVEFLNFGKEDILPLLPADNKQEILPQNFTGPFFTVRGDMKRITEVIRHILMVGVLLGYNRTSAIKVRLERGNREQVYVHIHAPSSVLSESELKNLFVPYYPVLANKTGLRLGTGLEGYITRLLSDHLDLPLTFRYQSQTQEVIFSLRFLRDTNTLS